MKKLLLLYDTKESDFAKDVKDFLGEINIPVYMIPISPDKGMSLEEKENHYYNECSGALFLLTPGSDRDGKKYPSPSVNQEIGLAKQKYDKEKIFYLRDPECSLSAIDQKAYIPYHVNDKRKPIQALTLLLKNLKDGGFLNAEFDVKEQKLDEEKLFKDLSNNEKNALIILSKEVDGIIGDSKLIQRLEDLDLNVQKSNLIKKSIERKGLVSSLWQWNTNYWTLTDLGWKIMEQIIDKKNKKSPSLLGEILNLQ